jgi:hypothetical protein
MKGRPLKQKYGKFEQSKGRGIYNLQILTELSDKLRKDVRHNYL